MAIQSLNPATGEIARNFNEMTNEQVDELIQKSNETFLEWRFTDFSSRAILMRRAAEILRTEKLKFAEIITTEMGKIISESISEVEKCAWVCDYYAENAESILENELKESDGSESYVQFDPLGIVLAVMPWNFPFWQVFRFAAPGLMAGNVGLLKHASNVPQCALAIEEVFQKAEFPEFAFKALLIGSSKVDRILKNPLVKAATLTGSEPAGKKVAETCGLELKKTVLELGGSDPFIVLKDADIENAAKVAVAARMLNNGQSCIAAKRFIIEKEVLPKFTNLFVEEIKKYKCGDPKNPNTNQGSLAREDLLLELDDQVKKSIEKGAGLELGGKRCERKGAFYEATVLSNVKKGMPAFDEELFGPVAAIIEAENEEHAISLANDSEFGLGASLWTKNISNAKKLAQHIETGSVFVNGLVKSDPRLPFGGVKKSGYGRELSDYGIKEFVNIKTVWIR
ncbi:MAG: NAD-dependent succinate-semialdehyde dehydrogenase [Melioribacteraceae bacterium]|nr:NAD-dependent succinate-semialdehyde dehydrogenase [Melioribacteraceae bacterium]MCF8263559.1 NAD-dependent succinate-semialdehyde dehydrogenase [Melioribacteraceae bacterium]MCF8430685.1 NAD-dependent succinate-semialdehyde dehydrogenase [Melioribacteraceae bacterium]